MSVYHRMLTESECTKPEVSCGEVFGASRSLGLQKGTIISSHVGQEMPSFWEG